MCDRFPEVRQLYEKYDKHSPDELTIRKIIDEKRDTYRSQLERIRPFPGAIEVLRMLHERDVPVAIVSGATKQTAIRLRQQHFPGFWDVVVSGDDVTNGKPYPEPYLRALEGLHVRDQWACIAVENAPLGVESARAAQLTVLGILRNSPLDSTELSRAGASYVYASMEDVQTRLESIQFGKPVP